MFISLIEKIGLKDEDTLYILGDVLDRGPRPIKTLQKIMKMPNVICILGNHELMALDCVEFLLKEIPDKNPDNIDTLMLKNIMRWVRNGNDTTLTELRTLSSETQHEVIDFMKGLQTYKKLSVGGKNYLLVHGGLGNYRPDKKIDEYSTCDLVWDRVDYDFRYFEDMYLITGHTPTQIIAGNPNPGYIYKGNNHIAIDCGSYWPDGRLAAICLDTGEEFYAEKGNL